ncbi:MAG: P1 family peptidase, partial [Proteobacteria bacterium]|nr:P1 family peptidase [Pseudomonadota bacterium]
KAPAAAAVINGFGKSVGLLQLEELGQLETPIALTNTFSVPAVAQAQIAQCIAANPEVGRQWSTVNPLVLECNDGYLNDIQRMAVGAAHYDAACATAAPDMAQGAVGAGRGMSSFQVKGGIGTASRVAQLVGGARYTVGALVLANYGVQANLLWGGAPLGARLAAAPAQDEAEKGSIIMLLATDAPLDARQLRRLALRAAAGLARTGSVYGHGSGDIALAFSTAYTLPQRPAEPMPAVAMVHEALLDPLFQAGADGVEQAIIHALWHAEAVTGRDGHRRAALRDLLKALP